MYKDIPMLVIHPHPWYIKMFPNWQDYPSGWARALSAGDANAAHARELMAFAEAGCCFRYRKTGLFGIENGRDMLRRFFLEFPCYSQVSDSELFAVEISKMLQNDSILCCNCIS